MIKVRIVSWNCGGKFREKFTEITLLDADIYVIQECENPKKYIKSKYFDFAQNYVWIGENQNKGLAVFAKKGIYLCQNNDYQSYCLRNFLPVKVNDDFNLLAVWACKPYIEEYYVYQAINKCHYDLDTIILGDFNSNAIWDDKHSSRTHSAVVKELDELGLVSAYHFMSNELHGEETQKTFYLYRHPNKGYHIDYAFLSPSKIKSFKIDQDSRWLFFSDHKPVVLEIQ